MALKTPLLMTGLAVVCVAIGAFALFRNGGRVQEGWPSQSADEAKAASAATAAPSVEAAPALRVSAQPLIHVRDKASGKPVAGAHLWENRPGSSVIPDVSESIGATNEHGTVQIPWLRDRLVVVGATGFVPVVAKLPSEQIDCVIQLETGGSLDFTVLDVMGNPIVGAVVRVQSSLSTSTGWPQSLFADGHPGSAAPLWGRASDEGGRVSFTGLPHKSYRVLVRAVGYYPVRGVGAGDTVVLPPAKSPIVMDELWGVCAALPLDAKPSSWHWDVVDGTLDRSLNLLTSIEFSQGQLAARFPPALFFLGRPSDVTRDCSVKCRLVLGDGTVWSITWGMAPVSRMTPVFFDQVEGESVKRVRVKVRNADDGVDIPLRVYVNDIERGGRTESDNGEFLLQYGRYLVVPWQRGGWVSAAFANAFFDVSEALPEDGEVTITLREPLVKLEVRPRVEAGHFGTVHMVLKDASNQGVQIMNWSESDKPIVVWAPTGDLSMRMWGLGYENVERAIHVTGPTQLDVELKAAAK